jgi:hypothetical protein
MVEWRESKDAWRLMNDGANGKNKPPGRILENIKKNEKPPLSGKD